MKLNEGEQRFFSICIRFGSCEVRRLNLPIANDTLYILHDIIQIAKSLKTPLSGTHLITEKYLTINFIYNFWKSRQQHYFIMSSLSVVAQIIQSVLPEKWYNFRSWGGCSPPRPPGSYAYAPASVSFVAYVSIQVRWCRNTRLAKVLGKLSKWGRVNEGGLELLSQTSFKLASFAS